MAAMITRDILDMLDMLDMRRAFSCLGFRRITVVASPRLARFIFVRVLIPK